MLTYAITMTFVCGMVFGVLLTLLVAEFIRRHELKRTNETFQKNVMNDPPFNVIDNAS